MRAGASVFAPLLVAVLLLLPVAGTAGTGPAPRVETFDDGSAAVTLAGGLTVVLDPTVTAEVRSRLRRQGSLDRVIARHARGAPKRERAIRAYARHLGTGASQPRPAESAPARQQTVQPGDGAPRPGEDPAARSQPLATGVQGDAQTPPGATPRAGNQRPAAATAPNRRNAARDARAAPAPRDAPRRSGTVGERAPALRTGRAPPRTRRPVPPRDGVRAPLASQRPRQPRLPGGNATGSGPAGVRLPEPAGSLQSSSLSTTVVGPDPVASPTGLTRRTRPTGQ